MALNKTQEQFVAEVRQSGDAVSLVLARFHKIPSLFYRDRQSREWLVAIDATNKVASNEWYRILVEGLLANSGWLKRGVIEMDALIELEEHTRAHGVGEFVIELLIAMVEDCKDLTYRSEQITRDLIKAHFNGIQPITAHALFILKRFFEPRRPAGAEDLELLLWLTEETKGLDNEPGANRYLAKAIAEALKGEDGVVRSVHWRLFSWLESRDEYSEAELLLADEMAKMELAVPENLAQSEATARTRLTAGSPTRAYSGAG